MLKYTRCDPQGETACKSLGGGKHLLTRRRAQRDELQCGMSSNPTDLIKQAITLENVENVKMFFPI